MPEPLPQTITVGVGAAARRIAVLAEPAATPGAPGVFWLPGFKSDMVSTKATALADWARAATPKDAIFQFPDAGQALYPGLFRVYAKRAVYVDWKVGGQVNLLEEFADEWWTRWQAAGAPKQIDPEKLAQLGIDYIVVQPKQALSGREPDYRNAKYLAYRLR